MKNRFLIFIILLLFKSLASANELDISAKNISIDKKNQISTFKNEVVIKDDFGNTIETDNAIYNNEKKNLEIIGKATILTSEGYFVETEDLRLDKNKNIAYSDKSSTILDNQKNKIYLENFHYTLNKNIFKSIGKIKVVDKSDNYYEFTQIYINEKKISLNNDQSFNYKFHLFKEGGGLNESKRLDVPLLGQIPYSEELMLSIDQGEPLVFSKDKHPVSEIFNKIAKSLEE